MLSPLIVTPRSLLAIDGVPVMVRSYMKLGLTRESNTPSGSVVSLLKPRSL